MVCPPVPGDRIQLCICQVDPGLIQYTAVDDCARMRVMATHERRTARNTLLFLEKMRAAFPFPI